METLCNNCKNWPSFWNLKPTTVLFWFQLSSDEIRITETRNGLNRNIFNKDFLHFSPCQACPFFMIFTCSSLKNKWRGPLLKIVKSVTSYSFTKTKKNPHFRCLRQTLNYFALCVCKITIYAYVLIYYIKLYYIKDNCAHLNLYFTALPFSFHGTTYIRRSYRANLNSDAVSSFVLGGR